MTTIVTIDMGGTGATHAAGAREALSVPSMTDMGQSYAQANSARDQANTARGNANDAYSQANTAYSQANSARGQANTAYGQANSARSDANTTFATINTTFGTVNTNYQAAYAQANNARDQANTARTQANTGYDQANTARTQANTAYGQANSAYGQANAAYGAANTKLASAGGTVSGDLIITGNLTVSGNQTILNTEVLTTEDAEIILLSNTAGTPALNAGLIVNRGTSTNTFLRWNEAVDEWGWSDSGTTTYYFEDLRSGLVTTNTTFGTVNTTFATLNTSAGTQNTAITNAHDQANSARGQANTAYGQANLAYAQANSARSDANTTFATINTTFGTTNTTFATINTTFGTSNTSIGNRVLKAGDTMTGQLNISSGGLLVTGNVGIGTTSPGEKLHVVGNVRISQGSTILKDLTDNTEEFLIRGSVANSWQPWVTYTPSSGSAVRGYRIGAYDNAGNRTEWVRIWDGNVGIGTTSPSQKLHVDGGSALIANGSSNTALWLGNSAYGFELEYSTGKIHTTINSAKRVTVDNSGNVGIGVTTPQRKLDVFGSGILASFGSQMGVNSIAGIHFGYSESSSNVDTYKKSAMVFERTDNHNQGGNASGKIHFLLHNSGSTSASGSNSAVLTLDTDSNGTLGSARVGIGTTNPQNLLHMYGSDAFLRIQAASGNYSYIRLDDGSTNGYLIKNLSAGTGNGALAGALYTYTDNNKAFQHIHAGTPLFTILSGGNVGIGTTAPTSKLHVAGTGTFTGQLNTADIINLGYNTNGTVATSAARGIEFHAEGGRDYWIGKRAGAWTQPLDIAFYTGIRYHAHQSYNGHRFFVGGHDSTEAFSVGNGDNHVRVLYNLSVAGTITESSSIALKQNIDPITNALNLVSKLVGVTYDRKDGSAKNRAGLIKEEVEKVLPNIVSDDGIQYTNLIAYLVESIKELKAEIDTLKGK